MKEDEIQAKKENDADDEEGTNDDRDSHANTDLVEELVVLHDQGRSEDDSRKGICHTLFDKALDWTSATVIASR